MYTSYPAGLTPSLPMVFPHKSKGCMCTHIVLHVPPGRHHSRPRTLTQGAHLRNPIRLGPIDPTGTLAWSVWGTQLLISRSRRWDAHMGRARPCPLSSQMVCVVRCRRPCVLAAGALLTNSIIPAADQDEFLRDWILSKLMARAPPQRMTWISTIV